MTTTPERTDARANRARLLEAARQALSERGSSVDMREIAERAGVGVGTLYRHFPTRQALVSAILEETYEDVRRIVDDAEANPYAIDAIRQLIVRANELAERYRGIWEVVWESGHGLRVKEEVIPRERYEEIRARVCGIVARGIAAGELRSDFPPELIADFLSAALPFVYMGVRQNWPREEAAKVCVALLSDALLPR